MRPKIFIAVLLAGALGCAGIFFLKRFMAPAPTAPVTAASQPVAPAAVPALPMQEPKKVPLAALPSAPLATVNPSLNVATNAVAGNQAAEIQAHLNKLDELEANDDAESLRVILGELTNSVKEIRDAAVESTIQFGSRDAIPVLNQLAARTQDPEEKKALLDAAEFLALPTLMEVKEQARKQKQQNGVGP